MDKLLDSLLAAFDTKIDDEKGGRDECIKGTDEFHYSDGRVDGVDAGRYLVEKIFTEYNEAEQAKTETK